MHKIKLLLIGGAVGLLGSSVAIGQTKTFTLQEATIDQIQEAMADGALTSVELTSMYLNRIAIYSTSGVKLNAVPVINPKVFTEASAADALRAQGTGLGPLHGIPATYKDTYHVKGLPTSNGIIAWKNLIALEDASTVGWLKDAGVITLGKNNMDTFSYAASGNSDLFGDTISPYEFLGTKTSGSSGGSAVAVSANLCAFSMGGDSVGSIRIPAQRNGVCGIRPTLGLVSGDGTPLAENISVLGPLTRTVRDMAYVMDVIVADDPNNPLNFSLPPFSERRPASYLTNLGQPLAGKKFGLPKRTLGLPSNSNDPLPPGPDYLASFNKARAALEALGATVVEVEVPIDSFADETNFVFTGVYTGPLAYFNLLGLGSPVYADELAKYLQATGSDPIEALQAAIDSFSARWAFIGFFFAPAIENLRNGTSKSLDEQPFPSVRVDQNAVADGELFGGWMTANGIDALIFPSDSDQVDTFKYGFLYSTVTGAPNLVVPIERIDFTATYGESYGRRPLGIHFVGRRFEEANLLSYAAAFEAAFDGRAKSTPDLAPALPGETIEYSTALPPPSRPELDAPALRVAGGAKVTGKGKKAALVINGGARDASGLGSLKVYVNGKKIAVKGAANWKASVKLSALRKFVRGDARTVSVQVVARDIHGNTSVTTKNVKLPKEA